MKVKNQVYMTVNGTNERLPVTYIKGGDSEKTFLISAGIHGCEYVGIEALKQWVDEVDIADIDGTVICLHLANPSAFYQRIPELVPEDGKNLNRVFPGDENGTASEKLAALLTKEFHLKADYYADLHGGDVHEGVTPFVYFAGIADEDVVERSREMAKVLSVPLRVRSGATTGAYNSAALQGVPSILIERGGRGHWQQDEVDAYKNDIDRLLIHFGFLANHKKESNLPNQEQVEINKANYINAPTKGFWYPRVKPGEAFGQGDVLGRIQDVFGENLATITAESSGVVLYMTESLALKEGEALIAHSVEE